MIANPARPDYKGTYLNVSTTLFEKFDFYSQIVFYNKNQDGLGEAFSKNVIETLKYKFIAFITF